MTDKTSPRQMSLGNPPFVSRQPFIHPSQYIPGLTAVDIDRWRLIAGEPVNRLARKMIQREVSSLNFQILPRDLENEDHQEASRYYSAMFGDFRNLATRTLKSICEIPQGGAWEVGWMDAIFDEGRRGTLSFVKFVDAGTLWPTTDPGHPIVQIDPKQSTRRVWFRDDEIKRILAYPRDEFDRTWWQESPTESSFLAIEALSKIYVYYLKQLQDTPMAGILDLMDFSQEHATKWAENFREMLTGIDPIKIPILYEHEQPAQFLELGRNPSEMDIPIQFQRFAEMVLGNYGLSLSDLRMFDVGSTKAGAAVSRKISTQSGVGFFAELIKDAVQSLLPPYLIFTYDDVDIEQKRTKSQIRAADIRSIQSLDWMPVRLKARQLLKWQAIDIEFDPDEIEEEAKEVLGPAGGMGQAPGALKPGQLETGEGRTRDVLEDDAKTTAADGSRVFAKGLVQQAKDLVDSAVSRFKANFSESKYGRKKEVAATRLEKLMEKEFRTLGRKVTRSFVGNMMTSIYTQFPDVLTNISTEPMEAKAAVWDMRIAEFSNTHFDHYVEKLDELQIRIEALIDQLLTEADEFELSDEEFLDRLLEIYALTYEDGLLGAAELIQMELFKKGDAPRPTVTQSFRLIDPVTLSFLERRATETVVNIDNGTRYFLRRMLVEGVMQGMSVDVLTDKIQSELFGLPAEEAGKLNQSRIRSIVTTEINRADSLGRLGQMQAVGLKLKRWITRKIDVCIVCVANERYGSVPLDFEFEDVFGPTLTPPGHPVTCHCSLGADAEELDKLGTVEYWDGGATKEKADFFPSQSTKQSDLPFIIVQNGGNKPPEPVFTEKFNPAHEPAGTGKGGQFASTPGGGGRTSNGGRKASSRRADSKAVKRAISLALLEGKRGRDIATISGGGNNISIRASGPLVRGRLNRSIDYDAMSSQIEAALSEVRPEHLEGITGINLVDGRTNTGQYNWSDGSISLNLFRTSLNEGGSQQHDLTYIMKHEIGHNVWMQLTPEQRSRFGVLVGYPSPDDLRSVEEFRDSEKGAAYWTETEEGKQLLSDLNSASVTGVSDYGEQNVLESWAEAYSLIDWNTGEIISSEGLTEEKLDILREISQW